MESVAGSEVCEDTGSSDVRTASDDTASTEDGEPVSLEKEDKVDGFNRAEDGIRRRRGETGVLNVGKFTNTTRFIVSSQIWASQTPTRNCDVLLIFPANTDDHMIMWLLSRLKSRTPQLEVHVRHHNSTGVHGLYFTTDHDSLLQACAELEYKKPLKEEYGGGQKEFVYEDRISFKGYDDDDFFSSQERQSLVRHLLYNLRAVHGDELAGIKFLEGQAIVPKLVSKKVVKRVLPLHDTEVLVDLRQNWVQAFTKTQPLDQIAHYFGVKIGLYFAYLGHYTTAICIPALLGTIIYICTFFVNLQEFHDLCFVSFAMFNVLWATLYLEAWKRKSSEWAYRWGTLDHQPDLLSEPRPLYSGEPRTSPVTGRQEFYYPAWKRNLFRYFVSMPIVCMCLCVVLAVMLTIFSFDEHIIGEIKKGSLPVFCKFGPKILMAISIGVLDDIYKRIALWLNSMENYREARSYENHYILKLVCFQFVNSFLSLFYLAFYVQDMRRLREQLAALLITRQVIGNFKEALLPYLISKAKLIHAGYRMTADMSPGTIQSEIKDMIGSEEEDMSPSAVAEKMRTDHDSFVGRVSYLAKASRAMYSNIYETLRTPNTGSNEDADTETEVQYKGPSLTQAEVEGNMPVYDDTFEDYLEMFIQFGYVILFSSAFPLAALCALLNNIIEIRSDAFKLCTTFQRPFGQQVEDIGIWQDMLEIMIVIAIAVNSALIGTSGQLGRWYPEMSEAHVFLTIVILEHLILAFRCALAYAIPDVPQWIEEEMARMEFCRRTAFKRQQSFNEDSRAPTPARDPTDSFRD